MPNTIELATEGERASGSNKMAFIPEAGKDYEVIGINGNCGVAVHEVKSDGSLAPIQLFSPKSCI